MNVGCRRETGGWTARSQPPKGDWRGGTGGEASAETPGRAHSSGLYMGPAWPLWEAKCPRVTPSSPGPPIRAWNLVGWGEWSDHNRAEGS